MAQFDPRRADALFHAGTFNNNTVTMAAGVAGLTKILTPERSRDLNARGDRLRDGLNELFTRTGAALRVTGLGSVMNLHVTGEPATAAAIKDLVFFDLVARGFYLARRGLIALSLPVTDAEAGAFIDAMAEIIAARRSVLCAAST
jgi:glutamate-1-semialdehyde 2,1-aminomutase